MGRAFLWTLSHASLSRFKNFSLWRYEAATNCHSTLAACTELQGMEAVSINCSSASASPSACVITTQKLLDVGLETAMPWIWLRKHDLSTSIPVWQHAHGRQQWPSDVVLFQNMQANRGKHKCSHDNWTRCTIVKVVLVHHKVAKYVSCLTRHDMTSACHIQVFLNIEIHFFGFVPDDGWHTSSGDLKWITFATFS